MAGRSAGGGTTAAAAPHVEALPRSGLLLLVALTFTWGLNWPMMKLALQEVQPWAFRSLCLMIGGMSLLALTRASGAPVTFPIARLKPLALVAVFNITAWHLLSAYALLNTGSGRAAIIGYTMPLWATLLSVFVLGARLTWRQGLALSFGMAALVLLIAQDLALLGTAPVGALLMAGAALSWAIGTVLVKKFAWDGMAVMALTGWQQLIGGLPIVLGWWLLEPLPDLARAQPAGGARAGLCRVRGDDLLPHRLFQAGQPAARPCRGDQRARGTGRGRGQLGVAARRACRSRRNGGLAAGGERPVPADPRAGSLTHQRSSGRDARRRTVSRIKKAPNIVLVTR